VKIDATGNVLDDPDRLNYAGRDLRLVHEARPINVIHTTRAGSRCRHKGLLISQHFAARGFTLAITTTRALPRQMSGNVWRDF
jgi:hypothetical protein